MSWFGDMAVNAASGLINYGLGQAAAGKNAYINYMYNEKAAKNADRRTRALYEDYMSPSSRIAQLKAAGLSPSLYADGAGAGSQGVTAGAQGSGASGVGIPTGIMQLDAAQIRLANAQAEKAEAEAATESGNNERGAAEIAKLWAEKGAINASECLTRAQEQLTDINVYVADQTKDLNISRVQYETNKASEDASRAYWEAEKAGLSFQLDLATFESNVEKAANEAAELASRIALQNSQKALADTEKEAIADYVKQGYMDLVVKAQNATQYANYVEAYAKNLPKQIELREKEIGLEKWRIGIDAFNNLVRTAGYMVGASQLGDGGTTTDETFRTFDKNGKQQGMTQKHTHSQKTPKGFKFK